MEMKGPDQGVLVVTDMDMTKDHLEYVEQQLGLGCASVLETDPPWNRDGLEELKWQLRSGIPTSGAVLFNFSTMNTRSYSFDIIEEFVLFVNDLAVKSNVKVIISSLPPRYMGWWDERQHNEHHEVNSNLEHFMSKHKVDSARVSLAMQDKLHCRVGRVRESRFTEWGALSYRGIFLYLKNILSASRPPSARAQGGKVGWGSESAGVRRGEWSGRGGTSDKKLIRLLKNIMKQNNW